MNAIAVVIGEQFQNVKARVEKNTSPHRRISWQRNAVGSVTARREESKRVVYARTERYTARLLARYYS